MQNAKKPLSTLIAEYFSKYTKKPVELEQLIDATQLVSIASVLELELKCVNNISGAFETLQKSLADKREEVKQEKTSKPAKTLEGFSRYPVFQNPDATWDFYDEAWLPDGNNFPTEAQALYELGRYTAYTAYTHSRPIPANTNGCNKTSDPLKDDYIKGECYIAGMWSDRNIAAFIEDGNTFTSAPSVPLVDPVPSTFKAWWASVEASGEPMADDYPFFQFRYLDVNYHVTVGELRVMCGMPKVGP